MIKNKNYIRINGNRILYNNKAFTIDDLYNKDFLEYSDSVALAYYVDSYFVNELFQNIIQPYLALKFFIEKEKVEVVYFDSPNFVLRALASDILSVRSRTFMRQIWNCFSRFSFFVACFWFVVTACYLLICMLRIPKKLNSPNIDLDNFSIIRTSAAQGKISKFDVVMYRESVVDKSSIYSFFPRLKRMYWIASCFFSSLNEITLLSRIVRVRVGNTSVSVVNAFYGKRLVHSLLYEKVIDAFFSLYKNKKFFTGNNLDRFSIIEEVVAKRYNIRIVCIPHGLEYGFRFPKGFSGDIFYSTSEHAASYLNALYHTEKFIFDQAVAERMFTISSTKNNVDKKVVFFTEPREVEVNYNIMDGLIPKLKSIGVSLFVKPHPKDSKAIYSSLDVVYLDSLEEALVGNVCFARKSTTLLECIYNRSKAAAILTNSKDEALFYTFPSLQSDAIQITKNIDELFEWIELNIKDETNE